MLGATVAKGLTGDDAAAVASPIRSMRELPASNVYSPRARPPAPSSPPTSPSRSPRGAAGRSKAAAAAHAAGAHPSDASAVVNEASNLDYVAVAAMGVMLAAVAVWCSKDAMAAVDTRLYKLVRRSRRAFTIPPSLVFTVVRTRP